MDKAIQRSVEEQQLKSPAYFSSSLNLTTLPPTDVSVVKSHIEEYYPIYAPSSGNTPLEFYLPPNQTHFTDLQNVWLYMRLAIKSSSGGAAAATTVCGNFPIASLFSNLDLLLDNVSLTRGSNTYPYAAFITRRLTCSEDSLNSRLAMEKLVKEDNEAANTTTSEAYKTLKAVGADFEVYGKIFHGLFMQKRMLHPKESLRIILRRAPNSFYLIGADPATGSTFSDQIVIEEAILQVKKCVINTAVVSQIQDDLNNGLRLKYAYKDFDVVSYSIAKGNIKKDSDIISMGPAPDTVVVGFVDSKAFAGTHKKSPFYFQNCKLSSIYVSLDGEPQLFKQLPLNVEKKQYLRAYSQLFNMISGQNDGNSITPNEFLEKGAFFVAFDLNSAAKDDRLTLNREGSLRIHCEFSEQLAENIHVICYMVKTRLLEIDNQNGVFVT